MVHVLLPQVDLEASDKNTLYEQCFNLFKQDVIQEGFSTELEQRILEILESLETIFSRKYDITDIIPHLPEDSQSVEHIIGHSVFELASSAFDQWDRVQQTKIIQQTASRVTIAVGTLQSSEEDHYERMSDRGALEILFSRVYKKTSKSRPNIKNLESKVLFIQFYFANPQDRLKILSELTDAQDKHDFIISAWEVMKKYLKINPNLTLSQVKALYSVTGAKAVPKENGGGSSHRMYEIRVPSLEAPSSLHSFKLTLIADSSAEKGRIYLAAVCRDFAQKIHGLHSTISSLPHDNLDSSYTKAKPSSDITNITDLNQMVIKFLQHIMREYKFNKFKK